MRRKSPRATILFAVNPDKGAFPLLMTLPYENYNCQATSSSGAGTTDVTDLTAGRLESIAEDGTLNSELTVETNHLAWKLKDNKQKINN
uniref:Late expression factor 11 n=1 Tax=Caenorhabditis tropicalis TaxID=1561998 RepID=A0A1I7T141_9PELO